MNPSTCRSHHAGRGASTRSVWWSRDFEVLLCRKYSCFLLWTEKPSHMLSSGAAESRTLRLRWSLSPSSETLKTFSYLPVWLTSKVFYPQQKNNRDFTNIATPKYHLLMACAVTQALFTPCTKNPSPATQLQIRNTISIKISQFSVYFQKMQQVC